MSDRGGARPGWVVPGGVLLALVAYAVLVPWAAGATSPNFREALQPPSAQHWFGTDHFGHDLAIRTAAGLRISLLIAVTCAVSATLLGGAIGALAAVAGGWIDTVVMRVTDGVNALPHLLLGIVIVSFYRGSVVAIVASIALTHWPQIARIVRAEMLTVRSAPYVDAAYLWGATRTHVVIHHLAPAALPQAGIALIMLLPHAVWHESTLSFLGLGLSPERPSIGTLLAVARGDVLTGAWWTLVFPAGALVLTTLAVARLGMSAGAVRDRREAVVAA